MTDAGGIIVHFDGLCEPVNPGGTATYGFVVQKEGQVLKEGWAFILEGREATNNLAEYAGLCASLEWLLDNGYYDHKIEMKGDSREVISQMKGSWRARRGLYLPEYEKAKQLRDRFSNITFSWVPRKENRDADRFSRRAYEDYCIRMGREVTYHK